MGAEAGAPVQREVSAVAAASTSASAPVAPPAPVAKSAASAWAEPPPQTYFAPTALAKPDPRPFPSASATTATSAQVIDIPPPPHTLAHGRWEVKPATIWIALAAATLLALAYVLWRVRRAEAKKKAALARIGALRPVDRSRA